MAKSKAPPKKQTAGISIDEIMSTSRAENPFGLKNFMLRFKYRIGKPQTPSSFPYKKFVKRMLADYANGSLRGDEIRFPPLAFVVLRHKQ